jgi:hypothetical protein
MDVGGLKGLVHGASALIVLAIVTLTFVLIIVLAKYLESEDRP